MILNSLKIFEFFDKLMKEDTEYNQPQYCTHMNKKEF